MNIVNLIDEILAKIPLSPPKRLIISYINDAIKTLNEAIEPFDAIIDIAKNSDSEWDNIETNWESLTTNWESLGRFTDWFEYDATANKLTVKNNRIQRIKQIYRGGIEQKLVDYEGIQSDIYTGNEVAIVGKSIYFAADISAASSGIIQMRVSLSFPAVSGTETEYNLPDYFDRLIYNKVMFMLSSDENQKALAKEAYNKGIEMVGIKTNIYGERQ